MKLLSAALVTLGLLTNITACSRSNDQIAELKAELDAANAELVELKQTANGSATHENKQKNEAIQFPSSFGSGTWEIGVDIEAGTYVSKRNDSAPYTNPFCSWERLRGLGGTIRETITAGLTDGNAIVKIEPDDVGFTSIGCEQWVKR